MNRRLVDQFQSVQLPETVEEVLNRGTATCAEFNPWGTLLAAGGALGEVIIWDFATKGIARASQPHDHAVTSLAWTRDGRHVISAADDSTVSSLSVLDNKQVARVEVRAQPSSVCVNRENPAQVLVCFEEGPPELLDIYKGTSRPVPCVPVDNEIRKGSRSALSGQLTASAVFSRDGRCIYLGQSRGLLSVLDTHSFQFLDVVKLPGQPRIISVKLDRKGRRILANCSDRVIRWAHVSSPAAQQQPASFSAEEAAARVRTPSKENGGAQQAGLLTLSKQEFHNSTVERLPWQGAAFSQDSEHMVGVTPEHKIYAWSLHTGKLEKFLEFEGSSDNCVHMSWHPQRSCFVTVGSSGKIYVWAKVYKENWSAFAPDFEELTENKEYVEREDEFDVNPRSPERQANPTEGDDDELDVVTCEPVDALYYSTDEDPATAPPRLHHLPLEIEPQRPSTPEPNADEDADAEDGDSEDVDVVSVSPAEGSQQRQPQAEANGKRKRAPARSRSRSHDEEHLRAASRHRSMDGGAQQHKTLLSGLNELDLPHDMF
ncbi:g575 [Coccomyxa viridis]|uniref:G575 protein n=1 Tax=Coccomyxa viridis TaxID=1274662 RepID=A0ABP1FG14_9CHLO